MTGPVDATDNSGTDRVSRMSGSGIRKSKEKSQIPCKFYTNPGGCRAGESCPYLHVKVSDATEASGQISSQDNQSIPKHDGSVQPESSSGTRSSTTIPQRQTRIQPSASRVVQRPTPRAQTEDPRGFQIGQLRRRYSPEETRQDGGETILKFKLAPSDPDFPYEISALECVLRVPAEYAKSKAGKGPSPKLRVTNSDIPRGFQINVERGFDEVVDKNPHGTLLQHLNALDRDLETLLAAPKAETIKIVANRQRENKPVVSQGDENRNASLTETKPISKPSVPIFSPEEKGKAKAKREADTRQLEARMSRLPLYSKSLDGLAYNLPIEPRRRSELPLDMRAIKTIRLIVPELYDLVPCRIEFPGLTGDHLVAVQQNFEAWSKETPGTSLFALINRLTQNIHLMLEHDEIPKKEEIRPEVSEPPLETIKEATKSDDDKSHVVVIPRPPEWSFGNDGESESDDSESDLEELSSEELADDDNTGEVKKVAPTGPERGIMMSFPHLELHGIELLELISLSIIVKCGRCKEQSDATNIKNSTEDHGAVKTIACRKCANQMSIGFRMDLMHANCVRAGYLDLDGCTVVDMLPSYFLPTCTECSNPIPQPGVISVRAESTMAICRECHKRMSFRIPEIKFLQVSTATVKATQGLPRKRKENLGIKAGEQLPNRGRCTHYSKSYRWFRFSCCNKVFPCDRCHDLTSDHPNEHANRMICGYCSREQIYRPETCGICRASLIAKKGSGFWEGGKGTRDQVKMSRKDPRKYKRRGGNAPVGGK